MDFEARCEGPVLPSPATVVPPLLPQSTLPGAVRQKARAFSWQCLFSLLKRGLAQEIAVVLEWVLPDWVGPTAFVRKMMNAKPGRGIWAG